MRCRSSLPPSFSAWFTPSAGWRAFSAAWRTSGWSFARIDWEMPSPPTQSLISCSVSGSSGKARGIFGKLVLPCIIFEDEHLLVVNKPAGRNTPAPRPYAGEGLYDWLRNREPRGSRLAIIHRLDKETSGVMVFAKSPLANRSLTEQFTQRAVRKKYLLLTDRAVPRKELAVKSCLVRVGEKYLSRKSHAGGEVRSEERRVG